MTSVLHNVTTRGTMSHIRPPAVTIGRPALSASVKRSLSAAAQKLLVNTMRSASVKVSDRQGNAPADPIFTTFERMRGGAQRRLQVMLVVTGLLAGIAGLVLYEAICEGIGCSEKLHDRYHE